MTSLAEAQEALAAHLAEHVDADPIIPAAPAAPTAWSGYVWPDDDWVLPDDGYCGRSVGLVFDICAAVTNLTHAQRWIAERVDETWSACRNGVDLGDTSTAIARVSRPTIARPLTGELLVVRCEFDRFTLED